MKKILLVFCLFFTTYSIVVAQDAHCADGDNGTGADGINIICFKDTKLRNNSIVELTESEFLNLTDLQLRERFIEVIDLTLCDNVGTGMDAEALVRRVRRFKDKNISESRNNGNILGEIVFNVQNSDFCTSTSLTLIIRNSDPDPIPTLSQWGLIIFGLLVLNLGGIIISEKEKSLAT